MDSSPHQDISQQRDPFTRLPAREHSRGGVLRIQYENPIASGRLLRLRERKPLLVAQMFEDEIEVAFPDEGDTATPVSFYVLEEFVQDLFVMNDIFHDAFQISVTSARNFLHPGGGNGVLDLSAVDSPEREPAFLA